MERRDTIIPVRMSLSVHPESPQLECAFSYDGNEYRASTGLVDLQLLRAYRQEIALATQGYRRPSSAFPSMLRELQHIIPRPAIAILQRLSIHRPEATTLALEIMLNDPDILECYPWELLSEPGLLVDKKMAVVVWRSVARPKRSRHMSSAVLLVGSASFDATSTNAPNEIALLARLLRNCVGIHPCEYPSITFTRFIDLLRALQPSVIHIVTHGDIHGFKFQQDPDFSRTHYNILPQELGGHLATSSSAGLVLLNACDSASTWSDRPSMARRIATDSSAITIGMSAEIPSIVGFGFSESFFRALALGCSTIAAFASAIDAIRREEKFAALWSVPIMYAPPQSNVILFPTDVRGQVRIRFQELGRQLRQLESDTASLTNYGTPLAPGSVPSIGSVSIRLAYIRDLLDELETPALEGPEHFRPRLLLTQARDHAGRALEDLGIALGSLRDPRRSREQRAHATRSIRLVLREQARTFAQLEREFADSR
jgi:CHAT domain